LPRLVHLNSGNPAIRKEQHAMGDILNAGVVRDDEGGRPELRIGAEERVDHANSGL
jgi:hypothetical protein